MTAKFRPGRASLRSKTSLGLGCPSKTVRVVVRSLLRRGLAIVARIRSVEASRWTFNYYSRLAVSNFEQRFQLRLGVLIAFKQ